MTAFAVLGTEAGGAGGGTVAGADEEAEAMIFAGLAWAGGVELVRITRRYDFIGEWQIWHSLAESGLFSPHCAQRITSKRFNEYGTVLD